MLSNGGIAKIEVSVALYLFIIKDQKKKNQHIEAKNKILVAKIYEKLINNFPSKTVRRIIFQR